MRGLVARQRRNRLVYGFLVVAVIVMGLASRRFSAILPIVLASYAGDTLWAMMVFYAMALVRPIWSTAAVGVSALLFSTAIELSQLLQTPWLSALRATRLGGLVLGYGFLWSDLLCYSLGIFLAALSERVLCRFNR